MMNSAKPRYKMSELDKSTGYSILIILATQMTLSVTASIVGTIATKSRDDNVKYLYSNLKDGGKFVDSTALLVI